MSNLKAGVHIKEGEVLKTPRVFKDTIIPHNVVLPLSQHTGKPSQEIISEKDTVKVGTKIAQLNGFISSNLHASISGEVTKISSYFHPLLGNNRAIFIQGNGDEFEWFERKEEEVESFGREKLLEIIKEAGIVGLGGAAFPTYVKLSPPQEYKIDVLIINGCECEPYLASDDILMQKFPFQILKGIQIIKKIISPKRIIIAIEDNKQEALERMRQASLNKGIEVVRLKTKYPQGAEKQLIKTLLEREIPPGGLPFHVGVVVQNVATCYAIYEAVYKDKPLIERLVTVGGDCIQEKGVYLVRIGTLVSDLIQKLGGLKKEPKKVIFGGPMMGVAQANLDLPILKGTSGVLLLSEDYVEDYKEYPCIKCARCVDICPMSLLPTKIAHFVKFSKWDLVEEYNAVDCIECGCCEYICPSRIPLTQYIRIGKQYLMNKKREKC